MPTDYSNRFHNIVITKLSSNKTIYFKSFLTDYSDNYTANWDLQPIYGRTDPMYTYRNTVRKITIAFDVPSYDATEASKNYANITVLKEDMLYPVRQEMMGYDYSKGASMIVAPPLVKMTVLNFTFNGVVGWIDSYSYKFDLEQGYFTAQDGDILYPKLSKVSFNFNVITDSELARTKKQK